MKMFFLIAAIIGAVVPWIYFFGQIQLTGFDVIAFMDAVSLAPAAKGFTADLLISSFVFWAFMIHRHRFAHGPNPVAFIVVNLAIGLSCALPAYLYAMELRRQPAEGAPA